MSKGGFEYRLQQVGICVKQLSNHIQYLQNLFEICLQDYVDDKRYKHDKYDKDDKHERSNTTESSMESSQVRFRSDTESNNNNEEEEEGRSICKRKKSRKRREKEENGEIKREIKIESGEEYLGRKRVNPEYNIETRRIYKDENIYIDNKNLECNNKDSSVSKIDSELTGGNKVNKMRVNKNNDNNRIYFQRKKKTAVFSRLTNEEKELILSDLDNLGMRPCERKWGVFRSVLDKFRKSPHIFDNSADRNLWIKEKQDNLGTIDSVKDSIQEAFIEAQYPEQISHNSLQELANLCFDRGIGVIGAKFGINLFALEFLLQQLFPNCWKRMEENGWFNVYTDPDDNPIHMSKIDIVNLSNDQGVCYASKKSGVDRDRISKYRREVADSHT